MVQIYDLLRIDQYKCKKGIGGIYLLFHKDCNSFIVLFNFKAASQKPLN